MKISLLSQVYQSYFRRMQGILIYGACCWDTNAQSSTRRSVKHYLKGKSIDTPDTTIKVQGMSGAFRCIRVTVFFIQTTFIYWCVYLVPNVWQWEAFVHFQKKNVIIHLSLRLCFPVCFTWFVDFPWDPRQFAVCVKHYIDLAYYVLHYVHRQKPLWLGSWQHQLFPIANTMVIHAARRNYLLLGRAVR